MTTGTRGQLQILASDEDGPILSVARVNGVPWIYVYCTSTSMSLGKGYNLVSLCKNSHGNWVSAFTTQAGLCDDTAGREQGDCDFSPMVDGKYGRVVGIVGRQGPYGPGLICDAPGFWNIGSTYAPFKVWGS